MLFDDPFKPYASPGLKYRGLNVSSIYIEMRDRICLAADLYLPKGLPRGERIPTILIQTRYWRAMQVKAPLSWLVPGAGDPSPVGRREREFFANHGYATLVVDVRGTGASFGTWRSPWEAVTVQDSEDLLNWICAQPWSNGQVAGMGVSYLGTTAELLLATGHPAVRAVVPSFNHPDSFLDVGFPGGLLNERFVCAWGELDEALDRNEIPTSWGTLLNWVSQGVKPVDGPQGRVLLEQALRMHQDNAKVASLDGEITFRDVPIPATGLAPDDQVVMRFREQVLASPVPVFGIASWLDAGTADAALRRFWTYPGTQRVMVGAWNHGGMQQSSPYLEEKAPLSPAPAVLRQEVLRFLDATLQPEPDQPVEREAFIYTLGAETWSRHSHWPPAGVWKQPWYFGAGRALAPVLALEPGSDRYEVDFGHTSGVFNRWWELGVIQGRRVDTTGRETQRGRVLAYDSAPLERDLEIAGWPVVTLKVVSSEPDCAFYVYLEDIFPDGRIVALTEGVLRSIHRRVSAEPSPYRLAVPYHSFRQKDAWPLVPGEPAEIGLGLLPVSALVRKGHCLRVAIAGHDDGTFPRVPREGTPVWNVYWGSKIELPVKPG
jgi:putative CocE/NonD family hydrolase